MYKGLYRLWINFLLFLPLKNLYFDVALDLQKNLKISVEDFCMQLVLLSL